MRSTRWMTTIGLGLACGIGGCSFAVSNTESLLTQAGFRKLPADTPKRAEHLQTLAPQKLIRRPADGKSYYVFADPSNCKCLYVGSEDAYAKYKALVQRQEDAMYLEEQRQEESVQGVK